MGTMKPPSVEDALGVALEPDVGVVEVGAPGRMGTITPSSAPLDDDEADDDEAEDDAELELCTSSVPGGKATSVTGPSCGTSSAPS